MPQQIRTISTRRLLSRIGQLEGVALRREIEDRILDHLGISLNAGAQVVGAAADHLRDGGRRGDLNVACC